MPFAVSRGRRIYYERHGQGPAVLFLHGAGSNAATWWQQLPGFRGHSCLTVDARCFGRSVAPLEEFDFDRHVADALAVLDAEGVSAAAVVGQSLGGMTGLRLALHHRSRVTAFVSCDSSLAVDHPGLLETLRQRQVTQRAVTIEQRSLGPWFLEHQPALAALYAQINHFNPSAHSVSAEDWGRTLAALLMPRHLLPLAALRDLACPTLFVVGRQDPIVSVEVTRELAGLVPASEVAVIEDAGHSAYFEQAASFNARVGDFLRRHGC
jgi:3-oxoadipate enol-lactonase